MLQCIQCNKEYVSTSQYKIGNGFCSDKCASMYKPLTPLPIRYNNTTYEPEYTKCGECGKAMKITGRVRSSKKTSKSGYVFCSRSCSSKYNNKHKKHGNSRSKIEHWIESQLTNLYPNLDISYNNRVAVSPYELDIYISSLNLAFELNGIFHYEPIFGQDKLKHTQDNDDNKFYLCQQNKINLCILDTSSMKYFKPKKAQKYLDIICNIINTNLL